MYCKRKMSQCSIKFNKYLKNCYINYPDLSILNALKIDAEYFNKMYGETTLRNNA